MPNQEWGELLKPVQFKNATALTAAAEGLLFADRTVPGGFLTERRGITIKARFKFSNVVTTPGSITFRVRWGGLAGTILCQSSAIALNVAAQTDLQGYLDVDLVCQATDSGTGGTGTLLAMGHAVVADELAATTRIVHFMGSTGGASTNTPAAIGSLNLQNDTLLSVTYQSTVATGTITGMLLFQNLLN